MRRKHHFLLLATTLMAVFTALWAVPPPQSAKLSSGADLLTTSRVSDVIPVAYREGLSKTILDGDWDLAEAEGEIHSDKPDWGGLAWKSVKMPNTIQYALFETEHHRLVWPTPDCLLQHQARGRAHPHHGQSSLLQLGA